MSMKELVVVTGANGFIGRAVVSRLSQAYRVVGLDRPEPDAADRPDQIAVDLGDDRSVAAALATIRERYGARIASVIHLAAYYDISGEPNPLYDQITVQGTRRLIDGLKSFECEQFVFASTMLIHRPTYRRGARIDEHQPIEPAWAYPQSKVRAEGLLRDRHGDIPLVFLRIAGVYDDAGHSPFLAQQIARIYEHRVTGHFYPGSLCTAQSFVHLQDLTDAFARAVDKRSDLPTEVALLVGEDDALEYQEVQNIIGSALHGEGWTTLHVPKPIAEFGAWLENEATGGEAFIKPWMVQESNAHYILDTSRAHELLGWRPQHSLRDTLPKMVAALTTDPSGWYAANKLNPALVAWYGHSPIGRSDEMKSAGPAGEAMAAHMAMMAEDERKKRWVHFAIMGLGLWLAASPLILGVASAADVPETVRAVTIDRGLPPIEWRSAALAWASILMGLLIAVFGALSLSKRTAWFAQWANCVLGLTLLFVPLVFWSPSAAVYGNDTLVGALVIALSVLIPMMPGMAMAGMMDPKVIPPGWSYCPSTAAQRFPIVVMGFAALLVALHLAAYQLGYIRTAWEPFFAGSAADPRNGTEEIITSWVSKQWPIPDAGLGAASYMIEVLMAVMMTRNRWRTMPWMVTFFGILVVPLGAVSIYFIIIQPILLGTWSTPALIAATAMLVMIPFALDELIAMGQYLHWSWCTGKPFWRTFFKGGAVEGGSEYRADAMLGVRSAWDEMVRGMTVPWTLWASCTMGALLMLSRLWLGAEGQLANTDHLVGALTITISVIAFAEVARLLRFLNVGLGGWLAAAPLLYGGDLLTSVVRIGLGLSLIVLAIPRGRRSGEHYAGWDRFVL